MNAKNEKTCSCKITIECCGPLAGSNLEKRDCGCGDCCDCNCAEEGCSCGCGCC